MVRANENGLFSIVVGNTVEGLSDIDWAHGPFYLKSEVDLNGGNNYAVTSVQQLMSVPYALHAAVADRVVGEHSVDTIYVQNMGYDTVYTYVHSYDTVNYVHNYYDTLYTHTANYDTLYTYSIQHDTVYSTNIVYDMLNVLTNHYDTVYNYSYSFDTLHTYNVTHDTVVLHVASDTVFTHSYDTLFVYSFDTVFSHTNVYDTIHTYNVTHDTLNILTEHFDTVYSYNHTFIHNHNYDTIHTYNVTHDTLYQHTQQFDTVYTQTYNYDTLYSYHIDTLTQVYLDTAYNRTYDTVYTYQYDTIRMATYDTLFSHSYDTTHVATYDTLFTHSYDTLSNIYFDTLFTHTYNYDTTYTHSYDTLFTHSFDTIHVATYDTIYTYIAAAVDTAYVTEAIANAGYLTSYTESDPTVPAWAKAPTKPIYTYSEISGTPAIPALPANVSAFSNDAGYLTSYTESDPTVPAWAKAATKPSYAYSEITGTPTIPTVPTEVSAFTNDIGYLTSYTETHTLSQVAALGNSVNAQIKNLSNPTDALDAVNKQTMESAITTIVHRYDSIINAIISHNDSVVSRQDSIINILTAQVQNLTPSGVLNGDFSVAAGRTVKFSQGNLQYTTQGTHIVAGGGVAQGTWRFAEHQYDYIGSSNENASSSYTGYIDLFGWGTSGWNGGVNAYNPYSTSQTNSDYYPGGSSTMNLIGDYANADWGVYNAISNGGNQPRQWRTLTKNEWTYLFNTRTASTINGTTNARYAYIKVNSIVGIILFPDSFTWPESITAKPTTFNTYEDNWNSVNYTTDQWSELEAAGCVFLPAAGYRNGTTVYYVGAYGLYWSSTYSISSYAYFVRFRNSRVYPSGNGSRYYGLSVRLVKDN